MSTLLEIAPPETHDDTQQEKRALIVALAGNPNAGKTTLFNALTGLRQKVANYPGVTVERKEGVWPLADESSFARLIDLPGLYSLDAASIDEQIAREVIAGEIPDFPAPDCVVAVVDATNLERNLYLVTQLLESNRPLVVALTMNDLAARRSIEINSEQLSEALGVPVIPVMAATGEGLDLLARAVVKASHEQARPVMWRLSEETEREIKSLTADSYRREDAMRDLYDLESSADDDRFKQIEQIRKRLEGRHALWWQEPMLARYAWIDKVAAKAKHYSPETKPDLTRRIDAVTTHKIFGPLILCLLLLLIFTAIFSWANVPMDLIDNGFGALGLKVRETLPPGLFTDLIVDGIIAGVGGVLVFLPQIALLFLFIALLEDSGYMARAAFIMDRLMRGVGLHGKAFMPLLGSFACAIPGIMATRTIENPKDRLATIMIAPFMSCSARLPVYTLMIAAFFSEQTVLGFISVGALIIMAMYALGIAVAVAVAWVLKHTILRAPTPPLAMELPPYRAPHVANILRTVIERSWVFVRRAGTVILAISILLWALVTFPRTPDVSETAQSSVAQATRETGTEAHGETAPGSGAEAANEEQAGEQLRNSFAGRLGRLIEPAIAPLGFDWQMGIGLIASFAAREVLVSTLSIVYNAGANDEAESPSLIEAVRRSRRADGSPAWTPLVAVSMMVFFVLACQCMSTLAIVRRETNSWRWPIFMVGYMLVLAYIASLITYQGGRLLGFS
jgi:ferrous iron transport protein B